MSRFWLETEAEKFVKEFLVTHREIGEIPGCVPAVDVFKTDEDGRMKLTNRAPKTTKNGYLT